LESISFLITGTSLVRAGLMVNGMAPSTIAAGALHMGSRPRGHMGSRPRGHMGSGRRATWAVDRRDTVTVRGRGATRPIRKGLER
jgi:hypothetical protein